MLSLRDMDRALKTAFLRVKTEFLNVRLWIDFLNKKLTNSEKKQDKLQTLINLNQDSIHKLFLNIEKIEKKVKENEARIQELLKSKESLEERLELSSSNFTELKNIQIELKNLIQEFKGSVKGQFHYKRVTRRTCRDTSGTRLGHVRDMRNFQENLQKQEITHEKEQETKQDISFLLDTLTITERELLGILYRHSEPLSYRDLSRMLGRSKKTVRNTIYELRRKGLPILDRYLLPKEKGFFITKELKLELSGR